MPHVFVSYSRDDQVLVDRLVTELHKAGVNVWIDRERIKPGQRWQNAIKKAIEDGTYFIACFSGNLEKRDSSYVNEELVLAIEELRRRPIDRTWFIPVILTECVIPDRPIGAGETLRDIQWVDLVKDWKRGIRDILKVIKPTTTQTNLTKEESKVLLALTQHPTYTLRSISGISRDVGLDQSQISRILRTLVEAGLAAQTSGKKGIRWSITTEGKIAIEQDHPNIT